MSSAIIISICVLLLLAYVFDISSAKTKIPSVILLLLLGWIVRQITNILPLHFPDLNPLLPVLGSVGLILIVLEGSLELEFDKTKLLLISKSFLVAFIPMILTSLLLDYAFYYYSIFSLKLCLINAIPFTIISSAIAIPTAKNLIKSDREFIVYESSFSDILGILLFNFVVLNKTINLNAFVHFGLQMFIICIISFLSTIGLSILLSKIEHHIKFAPIIIIIILIYSITEIYHLPALIFIIIFGLFLSNLLKLQKLKLLRRLKPYDLVKEAKRFREIVIEGSFLIRAVFFLLFGYLIETSELLNFENLIWSVSIVFGIFAIRFIMLKSLKLPVFPLLFIAPRGLITILLLLSIPAAQTISLINRPLIIQVIIITVSYYDDRYDA